MSPVSVFVGLLYESAFLGPMEGDKTVVRVYDKQAEGIRRDLRYLEGTQSRTESVQSKRKIRLEFKDRRNSVASSATKLEMIVSHSHENPANEYHARMVRPIHYSPWSESHVNEGVLSMSLPNPLEALRPWLSGYNQSVGWFTQSQFFRIRT